MSKGKPEAKKEEAKTNTDAAAQPAAQAAAPAAPAEKKERTPRNVKYSSKRELTTEDKLAPQAREIFAIIHEAGKDGIARVDLLSAMEKRVKTNQPVARILAYYQGLLIEKGLVQTIELPKPAAEQKAAA